MTLRTSVSRRYTAVKSKLNTNHLWQRMVKHTIAVTISLTIVVIPAVSRRYGPANYLAAMTAVFCHCSQRFGQMAQALVLTLIGTMLGLGWSALGMYLSGLIFKSNEPAAYTIRAIFLVIVSLVHGYVRSQSPRLFTLVWLFLLTSFTTLVGTANHFTVSTATNIIYPILTAMGVLLLVNVTVFPEFSGKFLADTTIQTLSQTQTTLKSATEWFMEPQEDGEKGARVTKMSTTTTAKSSAATTQESKLAALTGAKGKLRAKLSSCKSALRECTYEIEYAVVPSRSLKPISSTAMAGLVRNVNTLISACESKFVLMGAKERENETSDDDSQESDSTYSDHGMLSPNIGEEEYGEGSRRSSRRSQMPISTRTSLESKLEHAKPQREIASGDPDVLETLLARVREPVSNLLGQVDAAIVLVVSCLAYCYDVERLPSGAVAPDGISLEELDIRVDTFAGAVAFYDLCFQDSLRRVAAAEAAHEEVDVMPSIETFLLASSLLSLRQAAEQIMTMLKHARKLVMRRQVRRDRRRLYWPRKINWNRFLRSGGEQDVMTLPENARKEVRTGKDNKKDSKDSKPKHKEHESDSSDSDNDDASPVGDEEANPPANPPSQVSTPSTHEPKAPVPDRKPHQRKKFSALWWRGQLAEFMESVAHSEHFAYALKLTTAVMLVSWIAFYGPLNGWFNSMRVVWAPLQLVLVFEVAIGSSLWIFFVRAFGVIFGCLWGYASYEIGGHNLVALVVILVIGIIPSAYVQLGTPYVKAGMISIVSMCIVALSTVSGTAPAWENFVKRLVAFLVGGTVALIVAVVLYPVRARDRLVESLSSTINHITRMQGLLATGSESPSKVVTTALRSKKLNARFQAASQKAQNSLSAAETFLPFCLSEPRLKGSFRALEPIYKEIVYVLHQIIDRMDNSISLRRAYGSSVLEDMNPHVYTYRRNVSAAITLTLFAANEALTTKIPLPQFLPSCRLAQMRLVNRVREVIQTEQSTLLRGPLPPSSSRPHTPAGGGSGANTPQRIDSTMIRNATEQKFLSWSAAAAGQMEIIEYLEELVDLTKLLVGVNAFRSGMLERPSYRNYADRLRAMEKRGGRGEERISPPGRRREDRDRFDGPPAEPDEGVTISPVQSAPTVMRRRGTAGSSGLMGLQRSVTGAFRRRGFTISLEKGRREEKEEEEDQLELPAVLQRIGTRVKTNRSPDPVNKSRSN